MNYRKLLFFARTMNRSPEDNVYQLLLLRIDNFLNHPDRSTGFVKDITEICKKYDLFDLLLSWATESHAMSYGEWKCTLRNRISIFENSLWETYTENHSYMSLFHQTFTGISPSNYWKITSLYPDLVPKVNIQLRLTGNYGLQSGLPWLRKEKVMHACFVKLSLRTCLTLF